jgi:RNase P subunit RPR2
VNVRVRVHRGHVIVTCLNCGRQTRYQVVRTDNR